jgi:D-glycero-D-manno-heptose 1,7-bisphosphate phosphatase
VCLHHPEGGPGGDPSLVRACECRKPRPGLFRDLVRDLSLDPSRTWAIGDSASDLEAARAAGVRAAWIAPGGRCELCPMRGVANPAADVIAARFDDVVARILQGAMR